MINDNLEIILNSFKHTLNNKINIIILFIINSIFFLLLKTVNGVHIYLSLLIYVLIAISFYSGIYYYFWYAFNNNKLSRKYNIHILINGIKEHYLSFIKIFILYIIILISLLLLNLFVLNGVRKLEFPFVKIIFLLEKGVILICLKIIIDYLFVFSIPSLFNEYNRPIKIILNSLKLSIKNFKKSWILIILILISNMVFLFFKIANIDNFFIIKIIYFISIFVKTYFIVIIFLSSIQFFNRIKTSR